MNVFQSPRSGKFVSNNRSTIRSLEITQHSFNPLDRGNLYLIWKCTDYALTIYQKFQSPRSGKFVSNEDNVAVVATIKALVSIP